MRPKKEDMLLCLPTLSQFRDDKRDTRYCGHPFFAECDSISVTKVIDLKVLSTGSIAQVFAFVHFIFDDEQELKTTINKNSQHS
mgnify:FL=1|jgi:hypothetical protein